MEKFMERIKNESKLREKYDAILKKHESARDIKAAAEEIAALARAEGVDATADDVLNALNPKREMSEEQLDGVSGGGNAMALCCYTNKYPGEELTGKYGDVYRASCKKAGDIMCNVMGCRCWGTENCVDGYHITDGWGNSFWFHAVFVKDA